MRLERAAGGAAWYSMAFQIFLVFVLGAAIFGFAVLQRQALLDRALTGAAFVQRDWMRAAIDEETGVRGYVATGNSMFLDIYYSSLRRFVIDDRLLRAQVGTLSDAGLNTREELARAHAVQAYFAYEVRLVREGQRQGAVSALFYGKTLFDRLRSSEALARTSREQMLFSTLDNTAAIARLSVIVASVMTVLALAGLGTIAYLSGQLRVANLRSRSDALTNLTNRRGAFHSLERHLRDGRGGVGVIYHDLDGFKKVNDLHGHAAGDAILQIVAERLRQELRGSDVVARMGGDEFLCVIGPGADPQTVDHVARRLNYVVTRPYYLMDSEFVLGCSTGWSFSAAPGGDAHKLIARADRAMYEAKASGGGVRAA